MNLKRENLQSRYVFCKLSMKLLISLMFIEVVLMAKAFALPLCQEYFKQIPHVEKVDVGTNDNELLSVYGFSLEESQLTSTSFPRA